MSSWSKKTTFSDSIITTTSNIYSRRWPDRTFWWFERFITGWKIPKKFAIEIVSKKKIYKFNPNYMNAFFPDFKLCRILSWIFEFQFYKLFFLLVYFRRYRKSVRITPMITASKARLVLMGDSPNISSPKLYVHSLRGNAWLDRWWSLVQKSALACIGSPSSITDGRSDRGCISGVRGFSPSGEGVNVRIIC